MKYCPFCRAELASDGNHQVCPGCGFANWDNPTPVVTGILLRGGKIVLLRANTRNGDWGLPSGFVEKEENAEQGLVREIMEETSLSARVTGWLGTYPVFNGRKNILLIAYEAVVDDGEPRPGDEISEIEECEPEEALTLLTGREEKMMVSSWIERKRNNLKVWAGDR